MDINMDRNSMVVSVDNNRWILVCIATIWILALGCASMDINMNSNSMGSGSMDIGMDVSMDGDVMDISMIAIAWLLAWLTKY